MVGMPDHMIRALTISVKTNTWGKISSDLGPIIEATNMPSVRNWMGDPCNGMVRSHPVHPSLQALGQLRERARHRREVR